MPMSLQMDKSLCLYHMVSKCQTYSHRLSHMASHTKLLQSWANLRMNYFAIQRWIHCCYYYIASWQRHTRVNN